MEDFTVNKLDRKCTGRDAISVQGSTNSSVKNGVKSMSCDSHHDRKKGVPVTTLIHLAAAGWYETAVLI